MAIDKNLFTVLQDFASKLEQFVAQNEQSEEEKNNAEICSIVKKMMNRPDLDDEDFKNIIIKLEPIYREGHRHSYSNISSCIYTEKNAGDIESQKNGTDNPKLDVLAENNERLHDYAIKHFNKSALEADEPNTKQALIRFHKLYDHINLEIVRLNNYDQEIKKAISQIQLSSAETQKQVEQFNTKIQESWDVTKKESEKLKSEYISILGIFASIVLSFTAGMAYSTSVLSNIHKASIYRTIIITALLGMIIIAIIWLLMDFIKSIHGGIKRNYWYIAIPELFLILVIIATCLGHKYDWFSRNSSPHISTYEESTTLDSLSTEFSSSTQLEQ